MIVESPLAPTQVRGASIALVSSAPRTFVAAWAASPRSSAAETAL